MITAVTLAGDVLGIVAGERKIVGQCCAEKQSYHRNDDGSGDRSSGVSHALASAIDLRPSMRRRLATPREKVLAKLRGPANPILRKRPGNEKAAPNGAALVVIIVVVVIHSVWA